MEISDSVLDLIGNTPLVRLSRVTQGVVPVPGPVSYTHLTLPTSNLV